VVVTVSTWPVRVSRSRRVGCVHDPIRRQLRQEARPIVQPFAVRGETSLDTRPSLLDVLTQIDPRGYGFGLPHHVSGGPALIGPQIVLTERRAFAR